MSAAKFRSQSEMLDSLTGILGDDDGRRHWSTGSTSAVSVDLEGRLPLSVRVSIQHQNSKVRTPLRSDLLLLFTTLLLMTTTTCYLRFAYGRPSRFDKAGRLSKSGY